eukprot:UN34768
MKDFNNCFPGFRPQKIDKGCFAVGSKGSYLNKNGYNFVKKWCNEINKPEIMYARKKRKYDRSNEEALSSDEHSKAGETKREEQYVIGGMKQLLKLRQIPIFMQLSDELYDLLEKIFVPEENRITIEEIFQHKWFKEDITRTESYKSTSSNYSF